MVHLLLEFLYVFGSGGGSLVGASNILLDPFALILNIFQMPLKWFELINGHLSILINILIFQGHFYMVNIKNTIHLPLIFPDTDLYLAWSCQISH